MFKKLNVFHPKDISIISSNSRKCCLDKQLGLQPKLPCKHQELGTNRIFEVLNIECNFHEFPEILATEPDIVY